MDRDAALDIARGLGIILVVFGHLQRGMLDLGETAHADLMRTADFVLYTTHMPLFFLLAGRNAHASIAKRGEREFLASRPLTILWPYALWSTLFVVTQQVAAASFAVHHPTPLTKLLLIPVAPIGVFWFLQSLFFAQIVGAAAYRRAGLLMACALLGDVIFSAAPVPTIPGVTLTVVHLPFFALGFLIAERDLHRPVWMRDGLYAAPALCGAIGLTLIAFALHAAQPVTVFTIPASCLGIAAILIVSKCLIRGRMAQFVAQLGRLSMPIYVLHIFTLPMFVRLARLAPPSADMLLLLVGTVFGVLLSLAAYRVLVWAHLDGMLGLSNRRGWPRITIARKPLLHPLTR